MKGHRAAALLLALVLLVHPAPGCARGAENTSGAPISIGNVEDFLTFARQCALDAWSQGKTFLLTADLDLSGQTFSPIPTFGGLFEGNGHRITGLSITEAGSSMGLFRSLQPGGVLQNLQVYGQVTPDGSAVHVGGLAGSCSGSIRNCSFSGTVTGKRNTGGIAGQVTAAGEVSGCTAAGTVTGETCTGGIAGHSAGIVLKCTNGASVNTTDPGPGLSTAKVESALDRLTAPDTDEVQTGLLNSHMDTGGIAGCSTGVIQSCTNHGVIGYSHVGYNVGGIVGHQSGYVADCISSGTVCGRKDVGGIVGQAEPDILLNTDGDTLVALRKELTSLDQLVDQAISHTDASRGDISGKLNAIGSTTDQAKESARVLLEHLTDFTDDNLETLNTLSSAVTSALDGLDPVWTAFSSASTHLGDTADRLENALDALGNTHLLTDDIVTQARRTVTALRRLGPDLDAAARQMQEAARALQDAVILHDESAVQAAIRALSGGIQGLGTSLQNAQQDLEDLRLALHELLNRRPQDPQPGEGESGNQPGGDGTGTVPGEGESGSQPGGDGTEASPPGTGDRPGLQLPWGEGGLLSEEVRARLREALQALRDLGSSIRGAGSAIHQIGSSLHTLLDGVELNWPAVQESLRGIDGAMEELRQALDTSDGVLTELRDTFSSVNPLTEALGDVAGRLADTAASGGVVAEDLRQAMETLRGVTEKLARDGSTQLTQLGQPVRDATDGLFASLSSLSGSVSALGGAVNGAGDQLSADLQAISHQITRIFTRMVDTLDSAQTSAELESLYGDLSEIDYESIRLGKVADSVSTGTIEGDRNVGGIAGAVGVDYSLDPEDDMPRLRFGATYELRAVVLRCVSRGAITGKRDCAGGVAGRMDLGTAIDCQSYARVTSSGGGYVGGIAGYADASVRRSWARCSLSGKEYVGGIAGWAARLTDCAAMATLQGGTEFLGSIAGGADLESGEVHGNRFLDTGTAGIDRVSYRGIAEPVSYEALQAEAGVPEEFLTLTLTLRAGENVVERISVPYGADLGALDLPEVPFQEGFYGAWPSLEGDVMESDRVVDAIYHAWVTLVSSAEEDGKRALALAEGRFREDAALHVAEGTRKPPAGGEEGEVWTLTLEGVEDPGTVPVRLLNRSGDRCSVWRLEGENWLQQEAEENGSYLCLSMEGTSGTFCIAPVAVELPRPLLAGAGGGLAALLLLLVLYRRRAKRRRRQAAARQKIQTEDVPDGPELFPEEAEPVVFSGSGAGEPVPGTQEAEPVSFPEETGGEAEKPPHGP